MPRLVTKLVPPGDFPLGQKVWGAKTALVLPESSPGTWRNALTGETLHAATGAGSTRLFLHAVFNEFPVALLEGAPA